MPRRTPCERRLRKRAGPTAGRCSRRSCASVWWYFMFLPCNAWAPSLLFSVRPIPDFGLCSSLFIWPSWRIWPPWVFIRGDGYWGFDFRKNNSRFVFVMIKWHHSIRGDGYEKNLWDDKELIAVDQEVAEISVTIKNVLFDTQTEVVPLQKVF